MVCIATLCACFYIHWCNCRHSLKCAHHSFWGQIVFTFIYYNSFPTSPLSVAKESTAVEKCVRQPWNLREAPHISTVISLLIHLIVDVKTCVRHFFVRTHPLYMRPQVSGILEGVPITPRWWWNNHTNFIHMCPKGWTAKLSSLSQPQLQLPGLLSISLFSPGFPSTSRRRGCHAALTHQLFIFS